MVNAEDEVWKGIVGYEELFSVSNTGKIFSKRTSKILKQNLVDRSYNACITKLNGRNGTNLVLKVHREVAKAFIPNPDNLPFVNHKDGDKLNNNVSNLEWVTPRENIIHALDNGLATIDHLLQINEDNRKLSDDDVRFVRLNYKAKDRTLGTRALARKYGVTHGVIMDILNGKTYLDVV